MVADRSFLAKVLYSLAGRGLFTAALLADGFVNAAEPANSTVFQVLGIPPETSFDDPAGRPVPMLGTGKPIPGLV